MCRTPRTSPSQRTFIGCSMSLSEFVTNHILNHIPRPNISLSALSPSPIPLSTSHTAYVPPHPQRGTPYHRYAILLVPQSHPTNRISVPVPTEAERLGFDYRAFSEQYELDASKGGGAHMWREVWDDTVSRIYKDVLSKFSLHMVSLTLLLTLTIVESEEPSFARLPKANPYAELKQTKRYI